MSDTHGQQLMNAIKGLILNANRVVSVWLIVYIVGSALIFKFYPLPEDATNYNPVYAQVMIFTAYAFLFISAYACFYNLYRCIYYFNSVRLIEDTPTSNSIHYAPQGYVELNANISENDKSIITPFTHKPCAWYGHTLYKRDRFIDRQRDNYKVVESGHCTKPLLLIEKNDICFVELASADLSFMGAANIINIHQKEAFESAHTGKSYKGAEYKVYENTLREGNLVYVLGMLETLSIDEFKRFVHEHQQPEIWQKALEYIEARRSNEDSSKSLRTYIS